MCSCRRKAADTAGWMNIQKETCDLFSVVQLTWLPGGVSLVKRMLSLAVDAYL